MFGMYVVDDIRELFGQKAVRNQTSKVLIVWHSRNLIEPCMHIPPPLVGLIIVELLRAEHATINYTHAVVDRSS